MRDTSQTGLVSQTAVLNRLVQLGFEVLLPWADHLGYDLAYQFTVHLGPRRPHFMLIVRQRSPEVSAVLLASLYEMMYVDVWQERFPESASCLALEASPLHKNLGGLIAQILCFGRVSR